jgi:hypothetical protein
MLLCPTIQIIKLVRLRTNADKRALTRGRPPPSARDDSSGNGQRARATQRRLFHFEGIIGALRY